MTMRRRAYRLLLRLFPREFREDVGDEMCRLFLERVDELRGRPLVEAWLWVLVMADTVVEAVGEWGVRMMTTMTGLGREMTGMDGWMQDLRFALRALMRRPGFTAAAVLTLTLGLGANVAIFSVVNAVLLRPLPYPESDRLVVMTKTNANRGSRSLGVDHPDVRSWQADIPTFLVSGYSGTRPTLTGLGDPEVLQGTRVTDGLLAVMGLTPALGRDLTAADDVPGGPRLAVLSHDFWTQRLGGSPDVLGSTVTLNDNAYEIVGVAPAGFDFPDGSQLWLPFRHDPETCGHGCNIMNAMGRVPEGMDHDALQARLDANGARLAEEFPDAHRDMRLEAVSYHDELVSDVRPALWVLMGAVGMVLLIACANVANLLMVRAAGRSDEIAVRATLGASRTRLLRQLLTESAVLALVGGVLGLGLAAWGTSLLVSLAPDTLPRMDGVALDRTAVAFGATLVVVVTALFGLAPALRVVRRPVGAALHGGRSTRGGGRSGLSRSYLLAGEVALSLSLLLGAGLLFRSLSEIRAVDMGFDPVGVERFRMSTPASRYDVHATLQLFADLDARLTALPGVAVAGHGFGVPLASGSISTSIRLLDRDEVPPPDRPNWSIRTASPGYLEALGMTLVRGRWFEAADRRDNEPVVVINQAAAQQFYPGENPIGKRVGLDISWGFDDDPSRTVVGVVGDIRSSSAVTPDRPTAYVPNAQLGADLTYFTMRLTDPGATAMPAAREVIRSIDPDLAITSVERLEDRVAREGEATGFYLTLLTLFSALALILAAVGLYGVVAYAVSRRTREIGIRVALGARSNEVVSLVIRQGVKPALWGVVVGLAGSWYGARALGSILYGVEPQDPLTLASVTLLLLVVVAGATLIPARRASRIPPASALRQE